MLPIEEIRKDFPILSTKINGYPLVYLDNAATTQMPLPVLERLRSHYCFDNANVHRGIHTLSERSTQAYEAARSNIRQFIGARSDQEIIFTQGTTDSINMVAAGLRGKLRPGSSIVVTELEHHSNYLPWQRLCQLSGARLVIIPCPDGRPDMEFYNTALQAAPVLVSVTQVSNLTGTVMPLRQMIENAHRAGAFFLVDGAQGVRHARTDAVELDFDYYCFSGHKIMGPTGIGVLYGKQQLLEEMEPVRIGGGMVDTVMATCSSWAPLPSRLEAGTPNYAGAIALSAAIDYLDALGRSDVAAYEQSLIAYAEDRLSTIGGLRILGHPPERAGAISFVINGFHSYDMSSVLDKFGIALRSGTHCAQPALRSFGVSEALRLSVAFYNTYQEIDYACTAVRKARDMLKKWMTK